MPGPMSSTPASSAISRKRPFVIAVQVLTAEVVGDEQVGPAVAIVVAPGGREGETVVVVIHSRGSGDVIEVPRLLIEPVPKEKIRRPVPGIVVRRRVAVLRFALEIEIGAQVQVQAAVRS